MTIRFRLIAWAERLKETSPFDDFPSRSAGSPHQRSRLRGFRGENGKDLDPRFLPFLR